MSCVLKVMVVVLATSSSFVAEGMEPLAGPLVTQTVMQAGGILLCVWWFMKGIIFRLWICGDGLHILGSSQSRSP